MTKEQDFKCQRILFTYEQMISDCIEKRKKARPELQQEWRDLERKYRTEALDFLKRYSTIYIHKTELTSILKNEVRCQRKNTYNR